MTDATLATVPPAKSVPDRLVQWSAEDRELAFELYYTDAGRKLTTLQEIISTWPWERPIPYRTLYHWRQVDNWDIEADKRADAYAPNRRRRTMDHLTIAAERFAAYLSRCAAESVEPSKTMIAAAKVAFDAAGYSPTRIEVTHHSSQPALAPPTTPEEAAQRIRLLREQQRQRTSSTR